MFPAGGWILSCSQEAWGAHWHSPFILELQKKNWDSADEIHRSLMVDHVNEVSQWMVGVKRLIAETRDLLPGVVAADTEEIAGAQPSGEA